MLPGLVVPSTGLQTFNRHEKRCVLVEGNTKAICIGRVDISSADAIRKNMKGRAMRVSHYFNDYCKYYYIVVITSSICLCVFCFHYFHNSI